MRCPFCGAEMEEGRLIGNKFKMKFMPDDKGLVLGIWAMDGIPLGKKSFPGRAVIPDTWRCEKCGKYIIDIAGSEKTALKPK